MKTVYLVGFDFARVDKYVQDTNGYYEKGQFMDRIKVIEADDVSEAVEKFLDKLNNWITPFEKQYVMVMDTASEDEWKNVYYRSEYAWLRKIGVM